MPLPIPRCMRCKGPLPKGLLRFKAERETARGKRVAGWWCRLCFEIAVAV